MIERLDYDLPHGFDLPHDLKNRDELRSHYRDLIIELRLLNRLIVDNQPGNNNTRFHSIIPS